MAGDAGAKERCVGVRASIRGNERALRSMAAPGTPKGVHPQP